MAQATLKGKTKWFKVLGDPQENRFKTTVDPKTGERNVVKDWSFNISVGSADKLMFRQNKVKKHVKFDEELGDFVSLDLLELDKKGRANPRIKVVDAEGNPWPEDKWVGNGSGIEATVTLDSYSFTKDGQKIEGCKLVPTKIVITDYVPYQAKGTAAAKPAKRTDNTDWTSDDE